jgi:DNA-binding NarL/FixJ family response regulator
MTAAPEPTPSRDQQTPKIRVMLVDEYALIRSGVRRILESEPDITVVVEAETPAEAVQAAAAVACDVIIMRTIAPKPDLLDAAQEIRRIRPGSSVLVLSQCPELRSVKSAMSAGATGYLLLKKALETDLARAVRALAAGDHFLSPELSGILAQSLTPESSGDVDRIEKLTGREKQVLQLIARGKSCREIAGLLGLSVNTVAVHRANVKNTLGVHKTAALVALAVQRGLVTD